MNISARNIERITDWINKEPDYSFIYRGYSSEFKDEQIQLENKELMQVCAHCLSVPRYPLFFKCGHLTCLPCLIKYYKHYFNFQFKIICPTCKQYSSLDEINTYESEKRDHPDSVSMRMFNNAFFICSHSGCGQFLKLDQINQHEVYECKQRRIHCPADRCTFISRVETVIIHSVKCPFHIIYCGRCKSSYNDSVWNHQCEISKTKRLHISNWRLRFQERQSLTTHLHGDMVLIPHSFQKSYESHYKSRFDQFKSQARNSTSAISLSSITPFSGRPIRILQRQHGVVDEALQASVQSPRVQRSLRRIPDEEDSASNFNFE